MYGRCASSIGSRTYPTTNAEPRAEAEEEHPPAPVAPERLHRRVVHEAHGLSAGLAEVEADPASAEVLGIRHRPSAQHRARIADRDGVVAPAGAQLLRGHHH